MNISLISNQRLKKKRRMMKRKKRRFRNDHRRKKIFDLNIITWVIIIFPDKGVVNLFK